MAATKFDYFAMPFFIPFLCLYWLAAHLVAWMITWTVFPSLLLAKRLYWACPFIPHIWRSMGPWGWAPRIGFEASYCINTMTRLLTLPMRPHLPSFYILGFPKCGTTSMAEYLRLHPGITGTAGLPYHETLAKETHFFEGVLGRHNASSRTLYRSFFPTVITRWWCEAVLGVKKWMCFDACPVHVCLPYVAQRIATVTPEAKLIIMMREPVKSVFSGEIMLRNMGVPLDWSFMEPVQLEDPRFKLSKEDAELWSQLKSLPPNAPLPEALPQTFYFKATSVLQSARYDELVEPYLKLFPRDNLMFIEFADFVANPEAVVHQVLQFVGADMDRYQFKRLKPAMKNDYKSRQMHPSVVSYLRDFYKDSNFNLYRMLQRDMGWMDADVV